MKVLFTGNGNSGSWQCRGVQLGKGIGTVKARAEFEDFFKHDIIYCVKRLGDWYKVAKVSNRKIVWDLVDFYPQPLCASWSRTYAIEWVRDKIRKANPYLVIYPNRRMKEDIGFNGQVLYHHHLPNIEINPIREKIKKVGYQGAEKYLGKYREIIEHECARRNYEFVVNPKQLSEVDIAIAFRHGVANGYAQQAWKSQVKLANAHGSGTPFIGACEDSYLETACGGEILKNFSRISFSIALDSLEDYKLRKQVSEKFLLHAYPLEAAQNQLRGFLEKI